MNKKSIQNKIEKIVKEEVSDLLGEALSASQAKAAHDKFKETGELPPHLKKLVKKIKKFEKDAKVKNIVVPGLEWMSKIKEGDLGPTTKKGKTVRAVHKKSGKEIVSVDNPSTRKILKKMGFVVKEVRTINVEPNWEGMWRFFKQMAKTNPKDWKRMERTLGSDWKKIDAMAKKNKWTESINENMKDAVYWQLVKNGNRPSEAKKILDKYYDKVSKIYKKASIQKKAEIISYLSGRNESVNEGMTKYHIRLGKTPGWYGVWDKNGKQKFEGDRKYVIKHLKKLKTRMGNFQIKSLVDLATDRRGKNISFDVVESVDEGSCGYGIDGKVGKEPAGPHLLKKRKKTEDVIETIKGNICINCGNIVNENLKKWFSDKWVNIGKKKKGGGHPPCGTSGKSRGYAKCVPASKAAGMSKKQKASATRRKRAAQNKAGRGGTSSLRGGGKKPIRVSTKPKK